MADAVAEKNQESNQIMGFPPRRTLNCPLVAAAFLIWAISLPQGAPAASLLKLTRADYLDRVHAVWAGQICGVLLAWPHEHQVSSTLWLTNYPKRYSVTPVDDDWYYEMCAVRAFEKHGIGLTAAQLGQQWLENGCGSWGSSEQARLNLRKGIQAPDRKSVV